MVSGVCVSEGQAAFQKEMGHDGAAGIGSGGAPISSQEPDYWPTGGWRKSSPEMQAMNSTKLNDMMQYVRQQSIGIDSVVVVRNGYVVFEEYPRPGLYGPENWHSLYSVTKSFSSALIGIAIKECYIDGVQNKLLSFFPNRTFANVDSLKEAITLEDVLTMTSGLQWDESTYPYGDSRNDMTRLMMGLVVFLSIAASVAASDRFVTKCEATGYRDRASGLGAKDTSPQTDTDKTYLHRGFDFVAIKTRFRSH